ncbi:MAG: serpin family protein, partial [Bacteroidota bacterium]
GLPALEASLGAASFQSLLEGMAPKQVEVFLPRFKLEKEFSLGAVLQKMGMRDAFDKNRADFSGISDISLYITHVLHKAFVEVNEEGTEAAAATGVVVGTKSAYVMPVVFRADRPFFFALRDLRTGSILFMGRMADPR